jgi:hypothetical protein
MEDNKSLANQAWKTKRARGRELIKRFEKERKAPLPIKSVICALSHPIKYQGPGLGLHIPSPILIQTSTRPTVVSLDLQSLANLEVKSKFVLVLTTHCSNDCRIIPVYR